MRLNPRLRELLERVIAQSDVAGLELVHAEIGSGSRPILQVLIDKPGGVTLDDCAQTSRRLSVHLDVEDFIPSQYVLEVASPGLDRGLYKQADYERFAGLPAHIRLEAPLAGQRNFHGTLNGLDMTGGEPVVLLEEATGKQQRLPLAQIKKANVEIPPQAPTRAVTVEGETAPTTESTTE